jgi:signal peptidase I
MNSKPRKWWAGLLSLFEPGLGQVYNGQARKGITILLLPLLFLPVIYRCLNSNEILNFLIIFAVLTIVYYIIAIGDAIFTVRKFKTGYNLKKYNKIIVCLGVIVLVLAVNTAISGYVKNNYVQAFKIPAASNAPTLLVGDHILTDRRVSARNPKPGALIVFEFPEDPKKDFVKRVVAIGGDTVEIRDKVLFINSEPIKETYAVYNDINIFPAGKNPRDNFGPVIVPDNACFVLGGNRDQSYDSRFWGFVGNEKIKGIEKVFTGLGTGKRTQYDGTELGQAFNRVSDIKFRRTRRFENFLCDWCQTLHGSEQHQIIHYTRFDTEFACYSKSRKTDTEAYF